MAVIYNILITKDIQYISIDGILNFRNIPVVKSWGERGYFLLSLKIQPHTPF